MRWKCVAAILTLGLSSTVPMRAAEPAPPAVRPPQTILEASAKAYLAVPALRDTMTYVVQAPGSEKEPKKLEYGFGAGTDAYVKDPLVMRGRYVAVLGAAQRTAVYSDIIPSSTRRSTCENPAAFRAPRIVSGGTHCSIVSQ